MERPQIFSSEVLTYLWVLGVSLWGGAVSFFDERATLEKETGMFVKVSLTKLLVRVSSAGFAGFITLYLCQAAHMPDALTGAVVGISAHLGTPAFMKLKVIQNLLNKG